MATSAVTPETAVPPPAAAKVGLVPILVSVLLAVLIAFGAVAGTGYWFVHSGRLAKLMPAAPAGAAKAEHEVAAEAAAPEDLPPTHVLALEPLVVNLSDPGGRAYLRASISLRLQDEVKPKGEKAEKPEGGKGEKVESPANLALRDTTLAVLASQTSDQLLATGGLDALKKHLRQVYALQNVNQHVVDVYVTDFLVQRG